MVTDVLTKVYFFIKHQLQKKKKSTLFEQSFPLLKV